MGGGFVEYILPKITVGCDTRNLDNKSHNFFFKPQNDNSVSLFFMFKHYYHFANHIFSFPFFLFSSFFFWKGGGDTVIFLIKSQEDDQTQNRKLTGRK